MILASMNSLKSKFDSISFMNPNFLSFHINSYLYIPLGGNRISKKRQVIAVLMSFLFMSYWHGEGYNVQMWAFGNFLIILVEGRLAQFMIKNSIFNQIVSIDKKIILKIMI